MTAALGLVVGCGKAPELPPEPSERKPDLNQKVFVPGALFTRFSESEPRRKLWTIRWKSSTIELTEEGQFGGSMEKVSGELFKRDRPTSKFHAERGVASKDSNALTLAGSVRVDSDQPKGSMFCERLRWDPEREVIEAAGNVRLETPDFIVGPFDRLWFSPELKVAGTPDLFEEKYAKRR